MDTAMILSRHFAYSPSQDISIFVFQKSCIYISHCHHFCNSLSFSVPLLPGFRFLLSSSSSSSVLQGIAMALSWSFLEKVFISP